MGYFRSEQGESQTCINQAITNWTTALFSQEDKLQRKQKKKNLLRGPLTLQLTKDMGRLRSGSPVSSALETVPIMTSVV